MKNYYIDSIKGCDGNDGTKKRPFQTLRNAMKKSDKNSIINVIENEPIYEDLINFNKNQIIIQNVR